MRIIQPRGIVGNILGHNKFGGASLNKQSEWNNMSLQQKMLLRKRCKDSDKDGVPNRWDCQPFNKFKQDDDKPVCRNCGKIHTHEPFTHCFSSKRRELSDDLSGYYKSLGYKSDE